MKLVRFASSLLALLAASIPAQAAGQEAQPPPPPPPQYSYEPPPPGPASMSLAEPARAQAPKYSLWVGGRAGLLLYGGGMYGVTVDSDEPVGDFVTNGLAVEADVGARISRRYIPYVAFELGLVGPGGKFRGANAQGGTGFAGLGFRFLAGDVDSVSFASDLSIGFRKFEVTNDDAPSGLQTWSATAFEFLRLGLGADIRFTSYFTLSPMVTISGGSPSSTSGAVRFAPGQVDAAGNTGTPDYVNHGQIAGQAQTNYYSIVLGCGAHFDLFGAR